MRPSLASLLTLSVILGASLTPSGPLAAQTPIVTGVVHDSVSGRNLAGAIVQLVAGDSASNFGQTIVSNADGEFAFRGVPDGRYNIGFFHPMLDSLGLEPFLRSVTVVAQRAVRVELATPSPQRLRTAICGAPSATNTGAVVMGFVRSAKGGEPLAGVVVAAEWSEFSLDNRSINRRSPRRVTTTSATGWYAVCDVPSPGSVMFMANRGADSTDRVELQIPSDGFVRRELFLGAVRAAAQPHTGDGRLSGTVVTAVGGRPLAGAQVGFANGPQTRTNEHGEWTIVNAPPGTRLLETRAVGHLPGRAVVDVIDSVAPVRVALVTLRSVLDTMKVTAKSITQNLLDFNQRRRTQGYGRFLGPEDIARRAPAITSELFRSIPGVYLDGWGVDESIKMRSFFMSNQERCDPAIFLNGSPITGLTVSELNDLVPIKELVGIEVYAVGTAPPQFQIGMSASPRTPASLASESTDTTTYSTSPGCGSIVIWRR